MKSFWTKEDEQYLQAHYKNGVPAEIARHLNKSLNSIYNRAAQLGLQKFRYYSASESQYVKDNFETLSYTEIAEKLGRSYDSVRRHCKDILKLKRTPEQSKAIMHRCSAKTQYQKGNLPHNSKHDGCISVRQTTNNPPYKYIRTALGEWELLHRVNYQEKYGPIADNINLRCIDGDTLNCDPDNWRPVSKSKNLDLNSGREELTDKYVLFTLSPNDKKVRDHLADYPEIIALKRNQLQLKRAVNEHSN